jgi:hypothetical protein
VARIFAPAEKAKTSRFLRVSARSGIKPLDGDPFALPSWDRFPDGCVKNAGLRPPIFEQVVFTSVALPEFAH